MNLGAYETLMATATAIPDPEWPDVGFRQLLQLAFRGRVIQTPDHPVLQRLQGAR
jgi:hypothetical protein